MLLAENNTERLMCSRNVEGISAESRKETGQLNDEDQNGKIPRIAGAAKHLEKTAHEQKPQVTWLGSFVFARQTVKYGGRKEIGGE